MSNKSKTYHTLVLVSVVLCIVGFIYNTFGTFDKFINGGTLVLSESKSYPQLPLPVFLLCNDPPYHEIPYGNNTIWQEDRYLQLTRNPEEILISAKNYNVSVSELRTVNKGRCLVINVHQQVRLHFGRVTTKSNY